MLRYLASFLGEEEAGSQEVKKCVGEGNARQHLIYDLLRLRINNSNSMRGGRTESWCCRNTQQNNTRIGNRRASGGFVVASPCIWYV